MTTISQTDDRAVIRAPFPYFGGKRDIAESVWQRLGTPKQYIEPFCGSAAVLLACANPAPLEVVGDVNGFIANFWRAVVHQHESVAHAADYPVSHIDLGSRHQWLMAQRERLQQQLQDPEWPGDAKVAGWWLWGQCCWIGSGWCEWNRTGACGQVANGQIPHVSDAGRGIQAKGKIPHVSDAGRGCWTSAGYTALGWLGRIAERMERVRVVHGTWDRCMNHHYGSSDTAVFFDPPYAGFESLYACGSVVDGVVEWCKRNQDIRIALCGHRGDYDLPGWTVLEWDRSGTTYGGDKTKAEEAIWFSPVCRKVNERQRSLFEGLI